VAVAQARGFAAASWDCSLLPTPESLADGKHDALPVRDAEFVLK